MREEDFIREEEIDSSLLPTEKEGAPTIGTLMKKGNEIANNIINEEDPSKLDELSQLFALNQKKRQLVRANKMSNLLELVDDEVISRFVNNPDVIEDEDLLKYWRATQDTIKTTDGDEQLPKITINNTQNINVNSSGLNRESRAKVLDVVNQILNGVKQGDIIDAEIKEKDS